MAKKKNDLDFENLQPQSDDQLSSRLTDLKKEQFNLRFQGATGQLANTARVREVRRGIAKIKTLQAQRAQTKTA